MVNSDNAPEDPEDMLDIGYSPDDPRNPLIGSLRAIDTPTHAPRAGRGARPGELQQAPFKPTKEHRFTVQIGRTFGISLASICAKIINPSTGLPIDLETLRSAFPIEMEHGKAHVKTDIAAAMVEIAKRKKNPDVRAGIFVLKSRYGETEDHPPPPSATNRGVIVVPADAEINAWEQAAKVHAAAPLDAENE